MKNYFLDHTIQCITRIKHKEDTCEYRFSYFLDTNMHQTHLHIQNEKCPKANIAAMSFFAIIFATFLIGLVALLIVRCKMYMDEEREYAKFEKEREEQTNYRFESPIYKSPYTYYEVPPSAGYKEDEPIFELK